MTIRQLTGLALLVSAVACDAVSDPAPFLVSDTSSPALSMRLGDTAIVTIDVTNISNSTVLVGPTNCNGDFELVGGSGVSYVPGDRFPCTLALVAPQPLAPGAMLRMRAFTTGRVIEPGSRTVSMPTLLSPGTYFLRSTVTAFQGDASPLSVRVTPSRITFLARK